MSALAIKPITSLKPSFIRSEYVEDLANIYHDDINLTSWQRPINESVKAYADSYIAKMRDITLKGSPSVLNFSEWIKTKLPNDQFKNDFVSELSDIVEIFSYLFDLSSVDFRLTPLTKRRCPRFHVNEVQCRLITVYSGSGTEWLNQDKTIRTPLLNPQTPQIELPSAHIYSLQEQEVGLLKGEHWNNREGFGVIHRSPEATADHPRLLLTLDIIN